MISTENQLPCRQCGAADHTAAHHGPRNVVRFPRASAMLEAQGIADVFRRAAVDLEELACTAHAYDPGTLRRKVRAITLAAVASAVDCEREP